MKAVQTCPLCKQSNTHSHYLTARDFLVSGENFTITRCSACKLLITNPKPLIQNSARYYKSTDYVSHTDARRNLKEVLYASVKRLMIRKKLNWIEHELAGKTAGEEIGQKEYEACAKPAHASFHGRSGACHDASQQALAGQNQGECLNENRDKAGPPDQASAFGENQYPPASATPGHTAEEGFGKDSDEPEEALSTDKAGDHNKGVHATSSEQKSGPKSEQTVDDFAQRTNTKNRPKTPSENALSLLDYGCGTGDFLMYASTRGYSTTGVEPDRGAREMAEKKGVATYASLDELSIPAGSVDVITLWHVLEHISDIHGILEQLLTLLRPEGLLVVAAPMANSYDAGHYKEAWAAWDVPRHLYHFTPETLHKMLKATNFRYVTTYPLPFDAWYISLLSEQQKSLTDKKSNSAKLTPGVVFKAARTAIVSNYRAKKRKFPWSSQVFIYRKSRAQW